jgi:glutathione S-transferase
MNSYGLRSFSMMAGTKLKKVAAPKNFKAPEPKPFQIADGNIGGAITGAIALVLRLGTGVFAIDKKVLDACARPTKSIIIYEYEASPFCRKVREACALLDLTVEYRPCPGARAGFSNEMQKKSGRRTVPYLVDDNNKELKGGLFESDDIIEYLFEQYGPGKSSIPGLLKGDFAVKSSILAAQIRGFAGSKVLSNARSDNGQMKSIELWGYEGSPFVRPVKEILNSLALPHRMVYSGRGSSNREVMKTMTGRFQVPYIEDPNTGVKMFESGAIVKYLTETYTTSE